MVAQQQQNFFETVFAVPPSKAGYQPHAFQREAEKIRPIEEIYPRTL